MSGMFTNFVKKIAEKFEPSNQAHNENPPIV